MILFPALSPASQITEIKSGKLIGNLWPICITSSALYINIANSRALIVLKNCLRGEKITFFWKIKKKFERERFSIRHGFRREFEVEKNGHLIGIPRYGIKKIVFSIFKPDMCFSKKYFKISFNVYSIYF